MTPDPITPEWLRDLLIEAHPLTGKEPPAGWPGSMNLWLAALKDWTREQAIGAVVQAIKRDDRLSLRSVMAYRPNQTAPTCAEIIKAACLETGLTKAQLIGGQRARKFARPRQACMAIAATHTNCSLEQIGQTLNRDHTTVMHGIRKAGELMVTDAEFAGLYRNIESRVVPEFRRAPDLRVVGE